MQLFMKFPAMSLQMFYLPEGIVLICFAAEENIHVTTPLHATE